MASLAHRPVLFFDIDNCLYPKSTQVHRLMSDLIDAYFETHLSLSQADANQLHMRYYKEYGLAIEGLVRHHKVDPLDYNTKVDDALPLEGVIRPNPKLRKMLQDLDTTKVKPWLLTNAYISHGKRVVELLEVDDMFEGITFCDYGAEKFVCKPAREMYEKAMREAGVKDTGNCFFVDDSFINCKAAKELGWTAAHLIDSTEPEPTTRASQYQINDLEELRDIYPQFFKSA
ncbi:pyrimidine 5-nucleotidase [Pseudovirgaria hyperparasitica]|uniref:Pyrimidine 5-nucleotidase n=1 Tax=Pseudovirgaria hyperparasitica TaxID=470096 RepID=A0A6A6WHK5_9PEZI|nr:pyrimidine 5-nucleotidase [Pseudovirgaria hyperparasitica]KAF2760631.1 pyrimidine 5-nucleotidase [Pseudovirgaria hyperparasitica]